MRLTDLIRRFSGARRREQAGWFAVCTNETGVYFAQVQRGAGKPQVLRCRYHAAVGVSSAMLEKLARDEHIAQFQITTLLDSSEYQVQMVEGVNVPPEEFKAAVRWRIKDNLSYSVDDAAVDVLQIPPGKNGAARGTTALLAVSAPNETIKQRVELFGGARLDLAVIDVPVMAQRNIAALFEEDGRGLAILSFDQGGGILTVTSGGELYMPRRIEVTLGQLEDADEFQRAQYLERVGLELQRSLDYFGRQFNWVPVQRLLIAAPERLGLAQALAPSLEVPAEQLRLADVLDITAAPDLADSEYAAHMFLALGAALREERRAL